MSQRFIIPIVLAAAAAITTLSPLPVHADDDAAKDIKLLQSYPKMTAEEMTQMLFNAEISTSPTVVNFELQNPFRERVIAALVIGVSYKKPDDGKTVEFEILAHAFCGPLKCVWGQEGCFNAVEAAKANATITLKEVYLVPGTSREEAKPGRSASSRK